MARKRIERRLPPLEELFPDFRGFPKKSHHLNLAIESLHRAAQRLRKSRNQPFYSMREVAEFFSVPLSTISLAYQHLENEGFIVRVRGSRTVLLGKTVHSQHPARSIVTLPLHTESFMSSYFTRTLCHRISEELWRHHFVANLIFSTVLDYSTPAFARRLVKQSDVVVWMFPIRSEKETILTLRDHGVRNVLLCSIEDPFLRASYLMDWNTMYHKLVLEWKAAGIRHVVVAKSIRPNFQKVIDNFLQLLRQEGFTSVAVRPIPSVLRASVEEARRRRIPVGCAILEHETSYQLCKDEPAVMAKLTTRCRVLFGRGRIHAPYFFGRDCRADVIGFDGEEIAARVAGDLGRRSEADEAARLLPRWHPQANLGEVFI